MDTEPQTDLFSYTFGEDALKSFIIHDNEKVIEKIHFGTKQLTRTDNKTVLVNVKFSLNACKNLSKSELDNLRDTHVISFIFSNHLEINLNLVVL